jgi:hypothetical protein
MKKEIDPAFDKDKHSVLVINTGNGLLNSSQKYLNTVKI